MSNQVLSDTASDIISLIELWAKLSVNQRDILKDLIGGIASEDISPNQVARSESARIALARFEAGT